MLIQGKTAHESLVHVQDEPFGDEELAYDGRLGDAVNSGEAGNCALLVDGVFNDFPTNLVVTLDHNGIWSVTCTKVCLGQASS